MLAYVLTKIKYRWRRPTFELRGSRSEAEGTKMRSILAVPLEPWVRAWH